LISGASGVILGGLMGGMLAEIDKKDFWTGGEKVKVYKSLVGNNLGNQNGECVSRCFEQLYL